VPALETLKVLELSRGVAAAYCARQFSDWGADVVVVEPDGGSPLRSMSPLAPAPSGARLSLIWENVAAGKRAVRRSSLGSEGLQALFSVADILVTDLTKTELEAVGLGADRRRRDLTMVLISDFGLDGPYASWRGSELVIQALSGYLWLNGLKGQPPLRAPGRLVAHTVGVNAFLGGLASHFRRLRTGDADLVEVSGMETLATMVPFLRVQYQGSDRVREGGTETGVRVLPCADGWISLQVINPLHRDLFIKALGIPESDWPSDYYEGGYAQIVERGVAFLSRYTTKLPRAEIFYALEREGFSCGAIFTPGELVAEAQLQSRRFFYQVEHPAFGPLQYAGHCGLTMPEMGARPKLAPRLDDQTPPDAVGWANGSEHREAPRKGERPAPLKGLRVADLTQAWMGPFASLLLADLGAEVIKVESHRRPDVWRQTSPSPAAITDLRAEKVNTSHNFNSVNRNKRDLGLDLTSPEGKALFRDLVSKSDVVMENYTSRVMAKFGLDYAALRQVKPDLVMTSFSGFGKSGPWSDFKTNGSAMEGLAGWDAMHRYPGGAPVLMGFYQADPICGYQMAAVTLVALIHREMTGQGTAVDGSMLEAAAGYIGDLVLEAQALGEATVHGNRHPDMAPHGVFPCHGQDRWIAIAVADDHAWRGLLSVPGRPSAFDAEELRTLEGRRRKEDFIEAELSAWRVGWEADPLMEALQAAGVAAGVVRNGFEALGDPHLTARAWFKEMTHPDLGTHRYNGFPWRFEACNLEARLPPPRLGEHSEELLKELFALPTEDIEQLKEKGVIGAVL
jgi:crotonobetainyl-CoA:carnitine CoA-transferase CaiB-like acyl-CoA transferase